MLEIIFKLISWFVLWILVWLIFYFLNKKKINYTQRHWLASAFFFLVSLLIVLFYNKDLFFLIEPKFQVLPFIFLILMLVLNYLAYKYVGYFYPNYKKAFEFDDFYFFAKFDKKYFLSKSFEILFQQIMIALLAIWLLSSGLAFFMVVFAFALIFGLGHVPNLFFGNKSIGLFFLIASIVSSFAFPFLILNVEWGFVYSYIVHWVFYIIAGFLFIRSTNNL